MRVCECKRERECECVCVFVTKTTTMMINNEQMKTKRRGLRVRYKKSSKMIKKVGKKKEEKGVEHRRHGQAFWPSSFIDSGTD